MGINDELFQLEGKLDKEEGPLSRRLVLRKALQKAYDDGWEQGHRDGIRDYSESQAWADRQEEESGDAAPG